ncbi:hypothetical protein R1flu_013695 [Riccia fluitans]|uniref:Uncharacterized protein n=1 Tax=Riccia fluitans TaxID=41844 RepID=A0ABD1YF42_9MARC
MERAVVGPPSAQSVALRIVGEFGQRRSSGVGFGGSLIPCMSRLRRWKKMDKVHGLTEKLVDGEGCRKSMMSAGVARALDSDTRPGGHANAAMLMEVDGVLCDVHRYGNRQAFNLAFQDMGLDCAQWTEVVYSDLMRAAGGVEGKMVSAFFTNIGWPTALPTNEKDLFVKQVMEAKRKALGKLALAGSLPLRPGLDEFVDEVLEAGVPLILVSAYYEGGEEFARILANKLGEERARKIRIINEEAVLKSAYGQLVLGEGIASDFDEQLAAAAARAVAAEKQRLAEEVASLLKLSVEVDTTFSQTSKKAVAALRAGAEVAERGVDRCILLASGHSGAQAAQKIGMPCVVVRSSLTTRAERAITLSNKWW